jgi:ABC-type amino acid transport substrate-binding protein
MPVVVPSAFAMVFLLSCSGGDSSSNEAVPDVTPSSTTGSDVADDASVPAVTPAPASETSVLAPVVESTVAPTTVVPTTVVPTTTPSAEAPVETAREPVELDPGDPATCEVRVGSGGAFSVITDVARGFDVAFAQALVDRVYGTTNICFIPLKAAERFPALADRDIDLLVRNTSATTSRDEIADFTSAYLLDGLAVAVRGNGEVADDLAGLSVAVPPYYIDLLRDNTSAEVVLYEDFALALAAFESGETDAIANDWTPLHERNALWGDHQFIFQDLTIEPISVFVREGDVELRDRLDEGVASLVRDGTWLEIYIAEFGSEPWYEPELLLTLQPAIR